MREPPTTYLIRVRGVLDSGWSAWFAGWRSAATGPARPSSSGPSSTRPRCAVCSARIRDLGLPLISLQAISVPVDDP